MEFKLNELNKKFKSEIKDLIKTVKYLSFKIVDYELKFLNIEKK